MSELVQRLEAPGQKRLLALDGGGIRGCLTLGLLSEIESIVRRRLGPEAVLADYFDLIGGTSTGSIIAAGLALGWSVEELTRHYLELGTEVFSQKTSLARLPILGRVATTWDERPLEERLKRLFGETLTLGSPMLRTGLCVVAKRADTFSVWPLINHPGGKYYEYNAHLPIWRVLRASAAAPTYFRPIEVDVGTPEEPQPAAFIDGGVSMANNPALQLFLVATLRGFPFRWRVGDDRLLLVSVGTGRWNRRMPLEKVVAANNLDWAASVPDMLMFDASDQNELLLQYLSSSPTARVIDGEVGDLAGDLLLPAMSYLRYNALLEHPQVERALGRAVGDDELESLRDMSAATNASALYRIGRHAARDADSGARESHFATFDARRPAPGGPADDL